MADIEKAKSFIIEADEKRLNAIKGVQLGLETGIDAERCLDVQKLLIQCHNQLMAATGELEK